VFVCLFAFVFVVRGRCSDGGFLFRSIVLVSMIVFYEDLLDRFVILQTNSVL
jgi:hypothetical protein